MVLIPLLQQSTTYQRNAYHDLRAVQRVTSRPTLISLYIQIRGRLSLVLKAFSGLRQKLVYSTSKGGTTCQLLESIRWPTEKTLALANYQTVSHLTIQLSFTTTFLATLKPPSWQLPSLQYPYPSQYVNFTFESNPSSFDPSRNCEISPLNFTLRLTETFTSNTIPFYCFYRSQYYEKPFHEPRITPPSLPYFELHIHTREDLILEIPGKTADVPRQRLKGL